MVVADRGTSNACWKGRARPVRQTKVAHPVTWEGYSESHCSFMLKVPVPIRGPAVVLFVQFHIICVLTTLYTWAGVGLGGGLG